MTVIVRELVTRLGFQVDNQGLNRFEGAIRGFQNRFTLTSDSIARAIGQVIEMSSQFADSAIYAKDLARYTGTTFEEIKAMQLALKKFNLDESTTANLFQTIAIGVKEASRGANNFVQELSKSSRGFIQVRKANNELSTTKDILLGISQYLQTIEDTSEISRIISNIPGLSFNESQDLLRFLERPSSEVEALIDSQRKVAKEIEDSLPALQQYREEIANIRVEWEKLASTIGKAAVPVVSGVLVEANKFLDAIGVDIDRIKAHGRPGGQEEFERQHPGKSFSFGRVSPNEFSKIPPGIQPIIINADSTIEIKVPPGTTEEQSNIMGETLRMTWEGIWNEKVREVFNNSPTVE